MFKNKRNWANLISFSRIFGVSFIFLMTPFTNLYMQLLTVVIYTVICVTDFLDGWVARRYNIVSDLGKVLDPLADKILVLVFLPLLSMHAITAFPVFLILAREFSIMGLRVFTAKQGMIISANFSGKIKTFITLPVCGILMGRMPVENSAVPVILYPIKWIRDWVFSWPNWVFEVLIWTMVAVTIWSFLDYLIRFIYSRNLQKFNNDTEKARQSILSFIPNSVSFINLFCGIFSIFYSFKGDFKYAAAIMIFGIILDAVDGKIARKLGVNSNLGAKLDSKADFVTFGIAPGILIYQLYQTTLFSHSVLAGALLGGAFYASVHFRLKRFDMGGHSDYFDGLPSPAGASIVAMGSASSYFSQPFMFSILIIFACLLMISTLQFPHNRVSYKKMFFRFLPIPTLAMWFLTIFYLLGVPFSELILHITMGATSCYFVSPLVPLRAKYRKEEGRWF